MRRSRERARAGGSILPSLFLAGLIAAPAAALAAPFLKLRPGPIDRPLSIAAADFDRDGYDDLAIANFQAGTIEILINRHDGTFAPAEKGPSDVGAATNSRASSEPFDMVVTDIDPGDVDGDAVANAVDNCPNVYNAVDATTSTQPDSNGNGVGNACETADCAGDPIDTDQDGVFDFDPNPMQPTLDNCPSMYNPGQEDVEGDRVGDACAVSPDLVVVTSTQGGNVPSGAVWILLNDGTGGFVTTGYVSGFAPGKVVAGDFTGDVRPDFAVALSSVDLVQFRPGLGGNSFGSSAFLQAGDGAQGAEAGDFDGDGDLDLAVANRTADSISIFLNTGTALPATATSTLPLPLTQSGPVVLLSGDLNGNPFADLVVLSQGRLVCVGGPAPGDECDTDADCADPQNPALNGQCMGGSGSIQVFADSASGALTEGQALSLGLGHRPRAGLLRDLNGDLFLDLAVGDFTGGQVLLYSGAGDGTFAAAGSFGGTAEPASLAALRLDPGSPNGPDLAVLDHAANRIDLYLNGGGMSFSPSPASPASPWRDTSAMLVTAADRLPAVDIVLLQRTTARLDALSGIGDGSFRAVAPQLLAGPLAACPPTAADTTGMAEADLRQDGSPDLAVLDATAGTVTVITISPSGTLDEQETVSVGTGAKHLNAGSLVVAIDDYDRDGVPNVLDDCPAVYNPALCPVSDPDCALTIACTEAALTPTDCDPLDPATLDPLTQQCDSDRNGIGDHCQVLDASCLVQDSDGDSKPDYDKNALIVSGGGFDFDRDGIPNSTDNCPTVTNSSQADSEPNGVGDACETPSGQCTLFPDGGCVCVPQTADPDGDCVPNFDPARAVPPDPVGDSLDNCPSIYNPGQEDNDGDHVGNACIIRAALDNCVYTRNSAQDDFDGDGVGNFCAVPPKDLIAASPTGGTVTLLAGDGTGALHPASASPLLGLPAPTAGVTGQFAIQCSNAQPVFCISRIPNDIAVAAVGSPTDPTDGSITVFKGDGLGGFAAMPAVTTTDDPDDLLVAPGEPVCADPKDPAQPQLRFDPDGKVDLLAAVEPGTSKIQIFLPSNQDVAVPGASPLVPAVAQPQPLSAPTPLLTALFTDLNNDGFQDLVALTSPPGGPSSVTVYIGIGNGLFFTDPTFSPVVVPAEASLMAATNVNLKTDFFLPEVVLFSVRDRAPIVLTNTLPERADIDGSGRVDGFDLAVLAASFGATRGEDFTLQSDGTLLQGGQGCDLSDRDFHCLVQGVGNEVPGQDLSSADAPCDGLFEQLSGLYGLAADVNLDGEIDGEDLAFLASFFGQRLPP